MLSKNEKQPPSFLEKAKAKRDVATEDLLKNSIESGTRALFHLIDEILIFQSCTSHYGLILNRRDISYISSTTCLVLRVQ